MPPGSRAQPQRVVVLAAVAAWASVVAWIGVVFWLGSGEFGGEHTSRVLVPVIHWFWPDAEVHEIWAIAGNIRSMAHMVEYAILALLSLRASALSGISLPLRMAALALGIAAGVSLLDEVRQSQLETRVGSLGDVALDLTGAGLAVAGILWLRRRHAAR